MLSSEKTSLLYQSLADTASANGKTSSTSLRRVIERSKLKDPYKPLKNPPAVRLPKETTDLIQNVFKNKAK